LFHKHLRYSLPRVRSVIPVEIHPTSELDWLQHPLHRNTRYQTLDAGACVVARRCS
jgi:hypothetical protein